MRWRCHCNMKNNSLQIRLSDRRKHKLMSYSAKQDKTITSLIEDWIDSLPDIKDGNSSSTNVSE
jgi:hypothetical protein